MNTSRYTPELIEKEKLFFNIPLYQRLFAWGRDEVNGLLVDLKKHFKESTDKSPYYLGILSCIGRGNKFDLIDGQQRFTVIVLMGIVLRQYDSRWNDFLDKGNRLAFVARPADQDFIYSVVNDVGTDYHNENMSKALEEIQSFVKREFCDEVEKQTFAVQIYERLSFFFSVLPDEYISNPLSLNKYFEAMNSAGKGLEQHEVLKVQLLKGQLNKEWLTRVWNSVSEMSRPIIKKGENLSESEYRESYVRAIGYCQQGLFEEAFHLCESTFDNDENIEIGMIQPEMAKNEVAFKEETVTQSILSFPEFLMMVLDIHLSLEGTASFYRKELLRIFKDNEIVDIPAFYKNLLFYRLLFDYYIITLGKNANGNSYSIINHQGLAFDVERVCQYESMLYVSQTPFYRWVKPLLMELSLLPTVNCGVLLQKLKRIDNNLRIQPTSIESLSYQNADRYWFWRLDYYLWESKEKYFTDAKQLEIVGDYIFRSNRSLEHLHPQDQTQNTVWPFEKVHSFGNLAMISPGFNSQQSNDPVTVKFARILDQANNYALQSIKLYCMFLEAKGAPDGWTIEKMEEHGQKMYDILVNSFTD